MVSIRGPRSALTDFIKENELMQNNTKEDPKTNKIRATDTKPKTKKKKTIKKSLPVELTNIEQLQPLKNVNDDLFYSYCEIIEEKCFDCCDLRSLFEDDDVIETFSAFLSVKRKMNFDYFKVLVDLCQYKLVVYDCSSIKNEEFLYLKNKIGSFREIHLHFCGQLKKEIIDIILNEKNKIESFSLTGGFLLKDIEIPIGIKNINLSCCSRLGDEFIYRLNRKYKIIGSLNLSKCYSLTEKYGLDISVNELNISETKLGYNFLKNLDFNCLKSLNISQCPQLFPTKKNLQHDNFLDKMINKEFIDISGISTIKELNNTENLKYLNAENCYSFKITSLNKNDGLEYLNVANLNLSIEDFKYIIQNFLGLKILNISWNSNVNDEIIIDIVENLVCLEKIHVFGCFNLTEKIAEMAWFYRKDILIIGNPSETKFLLN